MSDSLSDSASLIVLVTRQDFNYETCVVVVNAFPRLPPVFATLYISTGNTSKIYKGLTQYLVCSLAHSPAVNCRSMTTTSSLVYRTPSYLFQSCTSLVCCCCLIIWFRASSCSCLGSAVKQVRLSLTMRSGKPLSSINRVRLLLTPWVSVAFAGYNVTYYVKLFTITSI